ncbi:hypothetical protein B0J12DRAFT_672595 [Macrophomina phaseolina]|uniref:Secreted protein n=1 Tax=Macrophomina phaseolina TaxID=35725 RepID=A0ABQ8G323_9PEZI|nr:hypothetical protein B0J12DRAFT_672595 [Macrophomina phaseolina]
MVTRLGLLASFLTLADICLLSRVLQNNSITHPSSLPSPLLCHPVICPDRYAGGDGWQMRRLELRYMYVEKPWYQNLFIRGQKLRNCTRLPPPVFEDITAAHE